MRDSGAWKAVRGISGILVGVLTALAVHLGLDSWTSIDGFARFAITILVGGAVALALPGIAQLLRRGDDGKGPGPRS